MSPRVWEVRHIWSCLKTHIFEESELKVRIFWLNIDIVRIWDQGKNFGLDTNVLTICEYRING